MALFNLGGINIDHIYRVPHLPVPGETLDAVTRQTFLGGKGANMSVAAARAGAHVRHIGAVGADGGWVVERLMEYGVDTREIAFLENETAHALIFVEPSGENHIVVYPGPNREIPRDTVEQTLSKAITGDWFVTQNEVNDQLEAVRLAHQMGLKVAYAAAPFDADITTKLLPYIDLLFLNEVEAQQLTEAKGTTPDDLGVQDVVVTKGSAGSTWFGPDGEVYVPAHDVNPVDTTGAGDTFTGYVLACLDRGQPLLQALKTATKASALMVTRQGTADVIPDLAEVQAFSG